jgi:hypothetical protein
MRIIEQAMFIACDWVRRSLDHAFVGGEPKGVGPELSRRRVEVEFARKWVNSMHERADEVLRTGHNVTLQVPIVASVCAWIWHLAGADCYDWAPLSRGAASRNSEMFGAKEVFGALRVS